MMTYDKMDSPVGRLIIIASNESVYGILWEHEPIPSGLIHSKINRVILETQKQLNEYFAGKRKIFDLLLIPQGTPFQMQVWRELQKIPYGQTISYGEQAARIGDKKKARAVGMANGKNPISIVIPCHRVIGSNGHLTGFGGGLDKKAYLLNLERTWNI